jgi:hypothetical protein
VRQLALMTLLLLAACNNPYNPFRRSHAPHDPTSSLTDELSAKRADYLGYAKAKIDSALPWGWPDDDGDSFLFACLYNASGGGSDMSLAINPDGRPQRNPGLQPEGTPGALYMAGTPWSKDMETGFLWCVFSDPDKAQALSMLQAHIAYGRANGWDMCGPADGYGISVVDRLSKCKMSGGLEATEYALLSWLGGDCDSTCKDTKIDPLNADITIDGTGSPRHLAIIHRALRGFLLGGVDDLQLKAFKDASDAEPQNALYACFYHRFLDGDEDAAAQLLMDPAMFPPDRLTSGLEFSTPYLWNRDEATDSEVTADANGCVSYSDPTTGAPALQCGLAPGSLSDLKVRSPDWLPNGDATTRVSVDFLFASHCVLDK